MTIITPDGGRSHSEAVASLSLLVVKMLEAEELKNAISGIKVIFAMMRSIENAKSNPRKQQMQIVLNHWQPICGNPIGPAIRRRPPIGRNREAVRNGK